MVFHSFSQNYWSITNFFYHYILQRSCFWNELDFFGQKFLEKTEKTICYQPKYLGFMNSCNIFVHLPYCSWNPRTSRGSFLPWIRCVHESRKGNKNVSLFLRSYEKYLKFFSHYNNNMDAQNWPESRDSSIGRSPSFVLGQPFCPKVTLISPFSPEEAWVHCPLSNVREVELIEKSRQMQKNIV